MEWLSKWLIRHKCVDVLMYGIDQHDENYICIKMYHDNGRDRFTMVQYEKCDQIPSIMDEMYRQLIREVYYDA